MKVIHPYVNPQMLPPRKVLYDLLEAAGRTCYLSERVEGDTTERFIQRLMKRKHWSVLEHGNLSVRIVCDRGVTHELVRHRIASYSQESTRYCVAGDTRLRTSNPHNKPTIKELYLNKQSSPNGAYQRMRIKQVNEDTGELMYAGIKDIYYQGHKEVYEVTTLLGYTLTCTKDHEIYTPRGYVKLEDLRITDNIYVNGVSLDSSELYKNRDWLYHQNITLNKTFTQIAKEFCYNKSTLKKWARKHGLPKKGTGYFNVGRRPWNKGLSEEDDVRVKGQAEALRTYHCDGRHDGEKLVMKNSISTYRKYIGDCCEVCGSHDGLEVHHKDGNRHNCDPSNLITLCESCHQRIHNHSLEFIYQDPVINIEPLGVQEVYDIEMNSPYHNFIANGVVVHNCNYAQGKFNNEITVIDLATGFKYDLDNPQDRAKYEEWMAAMEDAERHYMKMLELGATPQEARSVLPTSTKTEIVVTMNVREWRHLLEMRWIGVAGTPHPQMREIAEQVYDLLALHYPILFEDLKGSIKRAQ